MLGSDTGVAGVCRQRDGETVTSGEDVLLLAIRPTSEKYADGDERWITQQNELFAELRRGVGGVRREMAGKSREPRKAGKAGTKGAVETVLLALASAGSVTAAVQCLQGWLTRDRTRVVEIIYTVAGREERIVLRGTHVDDAAAKRLTEVALARWGNDA
jgi:hypothetical protein